MLTPVPMVRVEILVLDRDLVPVSAALGRLGVVHMASIGALGDWTGRLEWPEARSLASEYEAVARRMSRVMDALGLRPAEEARRLSIAPKVVLGRATVRLASVEPEVESLALAQRSIEEEEARLEIARTQLELLRPLSIDLEQVRHLEFVYMAAGLMPPGGLARLSESLRDVPHLLIPLRRYGDRLAVLVFGQKDDEDVLDRALRSAYLEKVDVPAEFTGTPQEALEQLKRVRAGLSQRRSDLAENRRELASQWKEELGRLALEVEANLRTVRAWAEGGRTERTRLLIGWAPRGKREELVETVARVSADRAVVLAMEPQRPGGEEPGREIPTELKHNSRTRFFEALTTTFGIPGYWDLDPTSVTAVLFLVMFGAMFGDLGQGGVLALIGLMLARGWPIKGQQTFGAIMMACGLSAMLFGVFYGSVFSSENVIPPLLFSPIHNIQTFILLSIGFGAAVLSLGLIFGVLSAWRRRDLRGVFLGQYGLAGLLLYWGLLLLIALMLTGGFTVLFLPVVLIPLALLFLSGPLSRLFGWSHESTGGTYYVVAGVEVFDLVVRLVSNTLSFIRISAFALSHAGLGITIYTLASLFSSVPGVPFLVLVGGNALIIGLEGLIVGIQALRLQYYEFFTKFLSGQGTPYHPFWLPRAKELKPEKEAA